MVIGASDNTDPGCSRATNPDMALNCSSGPNITMASGSSKGRPLRSAWPWLQHDPWIPSWSHVADPALGAHRPLVATGTTYVHSDPDHYGATDPDMALKIAIWTEVTPSFSWFLLLF